MTNKKKFEYVITNIMNCPHEKINGKICSACKIPDSTCIKCGGENYKHYITCPAFKEILLKN
jgi:hypothetical protein